jgi:CheY-like chemotaxis protein
MNSAGTVLYVEDDDNDVLLLRRAWAKNGVRHRLQTVPDGHEAIRYLSGDGPYINRVEHPLPALVLLDWRLPRVSGLGVLRWMRAKPALRAQRVIVLSATRQSIASDTARALRLEAHLVKPEHFGGWLTMVHTLKAWLAE